MVKFNFEKELTKDEINAFKKLWYDKFLVKKGNFETLFEFIAKNMRM